MVTLQILVLSFLVRVRVSQLESIFHLKDAFFVYTPELLFHDTIKPRAFALGLYNFNEFYYLFSASIALIFSFTSFKSSFSFSTLRFISSTRLLPFLLAAFRKPRLFS